MAVTGITETQQDNLLALVAVMFNAPPGANNLSDFAAFISDGGSFNQLAANLVNTPAFQDQFDGASTLQAKIDVILVDNLGLTTGTDAYNEANTFFTENLNAGVAPGEVILAAADYIFNSPDRLAIFDDANALLTNKVAVAKHHSETLNRSADTLAELQQAFSVVTTDAASVTEAIAILDAGGSGEGTFTLTVNKDVATANVFNAPRVFDPEGDDQTNSLQDDDVLTGVGTNPTLNVDLVQDIDTGGDTSIQPTLNGIETLNATFNTNAAFNLDMSDAPALVNVNVFRIDETSPSQVVDNLNNALTSISINDTQAPNSIVSFRHLDEALAAEDTDLTDGTVTGDSTTVTMNDAQISTLNLREEVTAIIRDQGYETVTIDVTNGAGYIGVLNAEDLQVLNITGDQAFTLGAPTEVLNGGGQREALTYAAGLGFVAGSIDTINASGLTGPLDITLGRELNANTDNTSGVAREVSVTGTAGDDVFRIAQGANVDSAANNTDQITGGDGTDTMVVLGGAAQTIGQPAAGANILGVEGLEIRTGHDAGAVADVVTVDTGAFDALATILIRNEGHNGAAAPAPNAEGMTVNLDDLTATQAAAITVLHGTTGNNGMAGNIINADLDDASGTADTLAVTIADGVNTNPRFNVTLNVDGENAAGTEDAGAVENITITDNDTETNSVDLANFGEHNGTITITGGRAGDIFNLDADALAANRGHTLDVTGAAADTNFAGGYGGPTGDDTTFSLGFLDVGAGAANRLVANTIDASGSLNNDVIRVDDNPDDTDGGTSVSTGAGDDLVIFDDLAGTNSDQAGYTIADTVDGGDGDNDVLGLDGNGQPIIIQQSEWDNTSNFEGIRLFGNGSAPGALNQYILELDNDLIDANGGDMLTIFNDDHSTVLRRPTDVAGDGAIAGATDTAVNTDQSITNSDATIFATTLSASNHFTYDGEEGTGATTDRFIVNDANANGGNVIDGGDTNITDLNNDLDDDAYVANNDTLEIRNTATVTTGDLENLKNIGRIAINNNQATTQTLNLTLNDTVVDAMADGGHTAANTAGDNETLVVVANDSANQATDAGFAAGQFIDQTGTVVVPVAASALNVDASTLGIEFNLNLQTDAQFGGAGNAVADTIEVAGNVGSLIGHTIDMREGEGNAADSLDFTQAGGVFDTTVEVNGQNATVTLQVGATSVDHVLHYDSNDNITLNGDGGGDDLDAQNLTITGDGGDAAATNTADNLVGLDGNDTLSGLDAADQLTGGGGNDVFVFLEGDFAGAADTITDFDGVGTDAVALDLTVGARLFALTAAMPTALQTGAFNMTVGTAASQAMALFTAANQTMLAAAVSAAFGSLMTANAAGAQAFGYTTGANRLFQFVLGDTMAAASSSGTSIATTNTIATINGAAPTNADILFF
ncbi:beta strand repeat-containing protein [Roseospira goensis]|uniref:Calcium-binding protein n=1 Tax=Roseospira goensis TaxID=391922 RepID=A0A7W6WM86_9PROT|nr:hypothetical protein [Roseospira goensis]MBB4287820.1 hypothetical protein [Roseospira goensis]